MMLWPMAFYDWFTKTTLDPEGPAGTQAWIRPVLYTQDPTFFDDD